MVTIFPLLSMLLFIIYLFLVLFPNIPASNCTLPLPNVNDWVSHSTFEKAVLEGEVVRNYACSDHGTLECSGYIQLTRFTFTHLLLHCTLALSNQHRTVNLDSHKFRTPHYSLAPSTHTDFRMAVILRNHPDAWMIGFLSYNPQTVSIVLANKHI